MDIVRFGHPLKRRRPPPRQACCVAVALLVAVVLPAGAGAVPLTILADSGANPAEIQPTVNAFRAALGDPNNGNSAGPLATGRREINWDGGGQMTTVTVGPLNAFRDTRGAQFITPAPGSGFIQAPPSGLVTQFNNLTYATFLTFSDPRLFSPIGSTVTNVGFFVPGTDGGIAATTLGFGAVFSDVDFPTTASLSFVTASGPQGPFFVPPANGGLSFLGVIFPADQRISQVQILSGNVPLGISESGAIDIVVMDDFLFREPAAVPEPATLFLLGTTMGGIALAARRRRARQP